MITIVGAGPAGSYLAYLLAKQGKEVTILEEHSKVGAPVQCTGIVTHSIEKFFRLKELHRNAGKSKACNGHNSI